MKHKHLQVLATVTAGFLLASCNFLDVVPEGSATTADIYKTQAQAERMVIGCYREIPD